MKLRRQPDTAPRVEADETLEQEHIPLTRLEDCGPLGEAVGPIAAQHDDIADDPNARGLVSVGKQSLSTQMMGMLNGLQDRLTELQSALRNRELAESWVTARTSDLAQARERHKRLERQQATALLPAVPGWLVYAFLALIAVGEWQLNRGALEPAQVGQHGTDILAAVAGAGMVVVVHLIGVGARRCVDGAVRRKPASSGWHYLALLSGVVAMLLAVWGLHELRAEQFANLGDAHGALTKLQLFLLWTGALLSLDYHNPANHMVALVRSRERSLERANEKLVKAAGTTDKARNAHRLQLHRLIEQLTLDTEQTVRSLEAFASGVQRATERPQRIDAAAHVAQIFDAEQPHARETLLREHLDYHPDDPVLSQQLRSWLKRLAEQDRRAYEEVNADNADALSEDENTDDDGDHSPVDEHLEPEPTERPRSTDDPTATPSDGAAPAGTDELPTDTTSDPAERR